MTERQTAEEKLARLRELILNARAMPMSASCVINRGDVLAAIDDVIDNLPDEIAEAQQVIDTLAGQDRARARPRPDGSSPRPASTPRRSPSTARSSGSPRQRAAKMRAEAEDEAAALRRETDEFIDSRMAELRVGAAQDREPGPDRPVPAGGAQRPGQADARTADCRRVRAPRLGGA